ncbi:MAG: transglutaminase family protein [Pseudomonadota bacterium]
MAHAITHQIRYRFDGPTEAPVTLMLRLKPWSDGNIRCDRWTLATKPSPADHTEVRETPFNNHADRLIVGAGTDRLTLTATAHIDLTEDDRLSGLEADNILLAPTRLVPDAAAFADLVSGINEVEPFKAACELSRRINEHMRYDPAATSADTDGATAFALGAGVCQDFAHILIGSLRTLGIGARYVAGYRLPDTASRRSAGKPAQMHGWVAVSVAPGEWRMIDPTRDRRTTKDCVPVAWGADYDDTRPVSFALGSPLPIAMDDTIRATPLGMAVD